jgi:molybdate/tungstate transport system substrate-binding protein
VTQLRSRLALIPLAMALVLAGCGGAATPSAPAAPSAAATATAAAPTKASGTVSVLYAGSLVNLMEHKIGPAFSQATGYGYSGYAAGSVAIANEVKGKLRRGDVFISAAPAVNNSLMGAANGSWVGGYITFATAPLVIGYNAKSTFAAALKSKPWQQVMAEPGFRLGGTDPKLDPKGQLTAQLLQKVAPGLLGHLQVFPEEDLVGRLQAGQLDAGFFYSNEAAEAGIPTIPTGSNLGATFTVATLANGANPAGGVAFVRFLLGPQGQALMKADGLHLVSPPQPTGTVPSGVLGG